MVKKIAFLTVFCFFVLSADRVVAKEKNDTIQQADSEQVRLELRYIFSNLFGFNITEIWNPDLYRVAAEWMGAPYKYGGRSKKGIDCSGLTCTLLQKSYKQVIQGSAAELYNTSSHIKRTELREGDLVFFKIRRKRISHVGIYLSDNKFVHASLNSGVIVSDLNEPYYSKYYFNGGRIIQ